jgi:16S rRNA G966 N2-methylase RsmD
MTTALHAFLSAHRHDDVRRLALQADRYPDVDMRVAIPQLSALQTAFSKLPDWAENRAVRYPPRLSMEQCSSQATARYKETLLTGGTKGRMVDLTGGLGVDTVALSSHFEEVDYVERDELLCSLARHNFPVLGRPHIRVHCTDAASYLRRMDPVDLIYIDPARRDKQGRKIIDLADCEPNLLELLPLLLEKADRVLVKLSPMLDVTQAVRRLGGVHAVHIVAVGNDCKELLLLLGASPVSFNRIPFHCVNLPHVAQTFVASWEENETPACYAAGVGAYLYEPSAPVMKSGLFGAVGARFMLTQLHPNSHLYTSHPFAASEVVRTEGIAVRPEPTLPRAVDAFPGRIFRVDGVSSFNKKAVGELLEGCTKANLTVRNFPATVSELRRTLKLKEGGDCYLFATTLGNGAHILIKTHKLIRYENSLSALPDGDLLSTLSECM